MAKKDVMKDKKNNFGKELKSELKKVTWPSFKQLVNNTYAVVAIVLIVAAIVFVLDVCFENLNNFSVNKLKALVSSNTEDTVTDLESSTEETNENSDEENVESSIEEITESSTEENIEASVEENVETSAVEPSVNVETDATTTPTDAGVETTPSESEANIPEANPAQ